MAVEPAKEWVLLNDSLMLGETRVVRPLENIIFQPPWSLLLLQPMKTRRWFSREPVAQMRCSANKLPLSHRAVEEKEDCSTGQHMDRLSE